MLSQDDCLKLFPYGYDVYIGSIQPALPTSQMTVLYKRPARIVTVTPDKLYVITMMTWSDAMMNSVSRVTNLRRQRMAELAYWNSTNVAEELARIDESLRKRRFYRLSPKLPVHAQFAYWLNDAKVTRNRPTKPVQEGAPVVSPVTKPTTFFAYCEFDNGFQRKFWEIGVRRREPTDRIYGSNECQWVQYVRFGRLGTMGQIQFRSFAGQYEAEKYAEERLTEKISKGYVLKNEGTNKPSSESKELVEIGVKRNSMPKLYI
jgi:predicted DNA-binding WGR domain protein